MVHDTVQLKKLEAHIGFAAKRKKIPMSAAHPHDETFSYGLCQRYYGKDEELAEAITLAKEAIRADQKSWQLYSLIGNLYYIKGDFAMAAGCFMKALSYCRDDITGWVELLFSLRAMGEFELFERGMFDLKRLYYKWQSKKEKELSQSLLIAMIDEI